MKVFKIVTNVGSEWNGTAFATNGKVYLKTGVAQRVIDTGLYMQQLKGRFEKVWVQEYDLMPVITAPYQQVLIDREPYK